MSIPGLHLYCQGLDMLIYIVHYITQIANPITAFIVNNEQGNPLNR